MASEKADTSKAAGAPCADDLLAQLAGDEVDRLLAEAENAPAAPVVRQPAVDLGSGTDPAAARDPADSSVGQSPADSTITDSDALAAGRAGLLEQTASDPTASASPSAPSATDPPPRSAEADANASAPVMNDDTLAASMDTLLEQIAEENGTTATLPPVEGSRGSEGNSSPADDGAVGPAPAQPASDSAKAAPATAAPAPIVGAEPSAHPSAAPQNPEDSALAGDGEDDGRVPVYVKILEVLNSPLDACSDAVRDAIGKIGLVTMVNAIAVLVYVFLFRHKK